MANWAQGLFIGALAAEAAAMAAWFMAIIIKRYQRPALALTLAGFCLLTFSIIFRAIAAGRGPFSNMYEFSLAFAWGVMVIGLIFWRRNKVALVAGITTVLALALLIFAATLSSRVNSLVPALQQSALLSLHVTAAVIAYGAFGIGFGMAIVYLVRERKQHSRLPEAEVIDRLSYQTVVIGFPLLTLTIILGAVWAEISWGSYWSWDPKETASLVTWLIYAGYLHARVMRGWKGKKVAILLIVGFCAVLFTFFGNYIFQGLHSYR
ncbi:MAG: c-type cytochrome biogenesis protein CcsB [Dehalococcoidales bacterium]|jgi:cytochrome c-type biogenesis protein CcsB